MITKAFPIMAFQCLAATAQAVPITISFFPAPPANGVFYAPGELVQITTYLSAPVAVTNIGMIQLDFSLSPPDLVDWNSVTCSGTLCVALPLVLNPPDSPLYGAVTNTIPSSATIPAWPAPAAFVQFNVIVPQDLCPDVIEINVLGEAGPDDGSGAFITTADSSVTWDNGLPGAEQILGGTLQLPVSPITGIWDFFANPPRDNPFIAGHGQPFRDVLQTGNGDTITQGIGAAGTPSEGSINYSAITLNLIGQPCPPFTAESTTVACNGPPTAPCPTVTSLTGSLSGPYTLTLSGPIPPANCTEIDFAGQLTLRYESLPGDISMNGSVAAGDIVTLLNAINNGEAALPANLPRYDVNRSGTVSATDVARLVGLLNGVNTTQPWLSATVAACP